MFSQFLGLVGMMCVVYAYHMTSSKHWDAAAVRPNLVNLIGAVLLIISLCFHFNLGSFVIEIFWIAIAGRALYKRYKERK